MKTKTTNTIYSVNTMNSDAETLVLIRMDDEGLVSAKFLDHVYGNEAFVVSRALKAVTGEEYGVATISKAKFIVTFGRSVAKSVHLV